MSHLNANKTQGKRSRLEDEQDTPNNIFMSSSDTSDNTSLKSFGCKEEILSMSMFIFLMTI